MAFQQHQMANERTVHQLESEDVIDLSDYLKTIKRSKWWILITTLICLLVGVVIARTSSPIFQASSKILANPNQPSSIQDERIISSTITSLFYETQYGIIQSRAIAETVVEELGLVDSFKTEQMQEKVREKTFIENAKLKVSSLLGKDDKEENAKPLDDSEIKVLLATNIRKELIVSGGQQSQIINISYQSEDPVLATNIINSVAQAYIKFGLEARLNEVKGTEEWLSEQSSDLKDQLTASENKLRDFRLQQGIVDSSLQQQDSNSRLQTLNDQLINAQTNLSTAEELYQQVNTFSPESNEFLSLRPVQESRAASQLVTDEARLQSKVNELYERYREKHPKMIAARSELKSVQESLSAEIQKIVRGIESNYKLAKQQVVNIQKLLTQEKENIQSLQGSNFTLTSLEREVENKRRIYESFIERLMQANITGDFKASNIQVIDSATVPKIPIKPNVKIIIIISIFIGLVLGVIFAFVREVLDNTYRTPDALEDNLNIPSLGLTLALKKKDAHGIPELEYSNDTDNVFAECINTIRTSLQFSNIENPPKTILITSATGSEGKSTLAMNLAAAYSHIGNTLLLEVDLRKPSIARNLKLQNKKGLTDLLIGEANLDECVVNPTDDEQFNVITCGKKAHNAIEILSSNTFIETLKLLEEKFDYIILDGPPTLPVSDACVLGNNVDGVIVAVKAETTKINVAKEAVTRLSKLNSNIIGAVLTVAEPGKMSYYGDHYYSAEYYGSETKKA
ncbi:polysaccharide biosynthesis tyrosine autokinase [Paraglaciecola sp.]|uniref:GumC family protein n=1 Tax=Paraglaciecola sp. TaxID=1920173 RepID=UPI0032991E2D